MLKINNIKDKPAKLYHDTDYIGEITNELQLCDIRLQVREQQLENVYIIFKNIQININKNGDLDHYPNGFFDTHMKQLYKLARW